MGYSLGDDKQSFDVFEKTENTLVEIGKQLQKKGWIFDKDKRIFTKENRDVSFDLDSDHVDCIYLYSSSIDWNDFCNQNSQYECCYDSNDNIDCVVTYVSAHTNISKLIRQLENSLVLDNKEKNNMADLEMF